MSGPRQELRQDLRLQLSQSLDHSLLVLRMSGVELSAALAAEAERNPFLELRLPEVVVAEGETPGENVTAPLTWRDHLLDQSRRAGWGERAVAIAEVLIHQLDDEGYLKMDSGALRALEPLREYGAGEIRDARGKLAQLSPPGMGASSLRERLLMQLEGLGDGEAAESARKLVRSHLDDMASGDLSHLGLPQMQGALELLAALEPRPSDPEASGFAPQLADIVVRKRGALWRAEPGPGLEMGVSVGESPHSPAAGWEPEARSGATALWRSACGLAQSVRYRRRRLLEVAQAAVDFQSGYFDRGPEALRPLRMADLAEEVGVSAATISLTVRGKTAASPRGFHELKYLIPKSFAKSGITRDLMKEALSQAIANEDPHAPMSDRELAVQLRAEGTPSRRAVAKLRGEMDIPPARLRKRRGSGPQK